jgi:hypothetical protein
MASRLSSSLKASVTIGHRPPFPYFSLVGFDGVTNNLDHPFAAKQADSPHAVQVTGINSSRPASECFVQN